MRVDGTVTIFVIQHQTKDGDWSDSNLDHFGHPKGFQSSDPTWQKYGFNATTDEKEAREGIGWIKSRNPTTLFRLVKRTWSKKTEVYEG